MSRIHSPKMHTHVNTSTHMQIILHIKLNFVTLKNLHTHAKNHVTYPLSPKMHTHAKNLMQIRIYQVQSYKIKKIYHILQITDVSTKS